MARHFQFSLARLFAVTAALAVLSAAAAGAFGEVVQMIVWFAIGFSLVLVAHVLMAAVIILVASAPLILLRRTVNRSVDIDDEEEDSRRLPTGG